MSGMFCESGAAAAGGSRLPRAASAAAGAHCHEHPARVRAAAGAGPAAGEHPQHLAPPCARLRCSEWARQRGAGAADARQVLHFAELDDVTGVGDLQLGFRLPPGAAGRTRAGRRQRRRCRGVPSEPAGAVGRARARLCRRRPTIEWTARRSPRLRRGRRRRRRRRPRESAADSVASRASPTARHPPPPAARLRARARSVVGQPPAPKRTGSSSRQLHRAREGRRRTLFARVPSHAAA